MPLRKFADLTALTDTLIEPPSVERSIESK